MAEKQEMKGIVRLAGADMKGEKQLFVALRRIKGVGPNMANAIVKVGGFDPKKKVGLLSNTELKKIDDIIKNPKKYNVPAWFFNRKKSPETGDDQHLVSADLAFSKRQDVKNLIDIKCYRGVRHMHGLPVRGQRTKSSFRKGRTVGVVRKKNKPATKAGKK
jgi:small subunit ribosomal protein S13